MTATGGVSHRNEAVGQQQQTKNLMMHMQQIGNNIQRKYNDAHATNMK